MFQMPVFVEAMRHFCSTRPKKLKDGTVCMDNVLGMVVRHEMVLADSSFMSRCVLKVLLNLGYTLKMEM